MSDVTIFLKTALFTYSVEPRHVPAGATAVEGEVLDQSGGNLTVRIKRLLDERGRPLPEAPVTLVIPWAKVDHLLQRS
jgi:hypothetical protein